jgi:predicted permease
MLKKIWSRFFGKTNGNDLSDELQFHLDKEIEQHMARGVPAGEARRQALISFGGVDQTREQVAEANWRHTPETMLQDLRFGLRVLAKSPGFALAAAITLALGIGANAYVFSMADALLVRPIAVPSLDRVMVIFRQYPNGNEIRQTTPADFLQLQRQNKSFESLSAFSNATFNLTDGDAPERVSAAEVTTNFFATLSVTPSIGRGFVDDEGQPGREHVAVLSYGLWTRRYGADPSILNREIHLNGQTFKVIGVAGKSINYPTVDLWVPISWTDALLNERKVASLEPFGRLKPGVTLAQSQSVMKGIAQELATAYPVTNKGVSVQVHPLRLVVNGTLSLPITEALALAAGLVLLISCTNVAGLLVARGVSRQREMAIRAALGARRWRLIRQLLAEYMLLAALGCTAAFVLAKWAVAAQLASFSPLFLRLVSGLSDMSVDLRAFLFMLVVTVFCVLIFGTVPAFGTSRPDLNYSLRESGQSSPSRSRQILRGVIVSVQVALALALLAGALLVGRGFHKIETVSEKFSPQSVLTFSIALPNSRYDDAAKKAQFYDTALERLRAIPGVSSAAAFTSTPFSDNGVSWINFRTQEQSSLKKNQLSSGIIQSVSPGYFQTIGIPLMSGGYFSLHDQTGRQQVAIVSERLARQFWPGEVALGKTLRLEDANHTGEWLTVVGVAQDVLYDWTNQFPEYTVYRPQAQEPRRSSLIALRTSGNPLDLIPAVRKVISGIDADLPVSEAQTLAQSIGDSVTPLRWIGSFVEALGFLAIVLAIVGVYGVMANAVSERTREIGIRIALGADRSRVLVLILRKSIFLTLAGIALGCPLALVLTRMLGSVTYGIGDTSVLTLLVCSLILFSVAVLACAIPARRASKVDPLIALRYE